MIEMNSQGLRKSMIFLLTTGVLYLCMPFFNNLQSSLNHKFMRSGVTGRFKAPIQIVYFDDADIEKLGGWPLPRNIYGFLIEKLSAMGARAIGVHVFWKENNDPADENDLFLQYMLHKHNGVIGAFYFDKFDTLGGNEPYVPELGTGAAGSDECNFYASGIEVPDRDFLDSGARFGFVNLLMNREGLVEEAVQVVQCGDMYYPSFASLLAQRLMHEGQKLPARMKMNYYVTTGQLPKIPVRDIISPANADSLRSKINGSIVILGVISTQLGFEKPTPLEPSMPVIGIHAHIVDNLYSGRYLRDFPGWLYVVILGLLGLFMAFAQISRLVIKMAVYIGAMLIFGFGTVLFWQAHIIFPLYAFLFGCLVFGIITALDHISVQEKHIMEELEKRQALEKKFMDRVRGAAKLEEEYSRLRHKYQDEIESIREELSTTSPGETEAIQKAYPEIVCSKDSPMVRILSELKRIGETDEPVLITGESGTGKELIAMAIHRSSSRAEAPFIAVNCGAISESLLESELFGHVKGAFTGASETKTGFFEAANNGTIFLDEISETSIAFQAKLLRVLQEGSYFRVGSTKPRHVTVRIIAATNQDIQQLIRKNKFRQDLFFRLNVLPVHLPPLRNRTGDILPLLNHFLKGKALNWTAGAKKMLQNYAWPGNIRELQNITARMKLLDDEFTLTSEWVKDQLNVSGTGSDDTMDENILELYRELKFRNDANRTIAERLGNMHRSTITEYLKGMAFQFFSEEQFNLEKTVRRFNPEADDRLDKKIKGRISKYLQNLAAKLDKNKNIDTNLLTLQKQIRKMPKRYHEAALKIAEGYLKGEWKV